ncbi:N amino acid transport system protein [Cytospora mali]|uniref:N amino acid transport system protein n=1 Tax=Cytospora mali TaxID=578113 RepID=A0A194USN8_CYTMA|nr:N amino acid transport system protein [Valsa mali var. pyri (nom. inval.)]
MDEKITEKTNNDTNATSAEKHSSEVGELRSRAVAVRPQERLLHDPNVTFEEYMFYAAQARAEEDASISSASQASEKAKTTFMDVFVPSAGGGVRELKGAAATDGSGGVLRELNLSDPQVRATITDEEWTNASRALRTATAAACFYLITTDILGPFGVGFALGTMGWGEGIGLYTVFGGFAGLSGYLLWKVFMHVDSYQFPAKNYGDLAYRIYGRWFRWIVNLCQGLQLLLSVGNIIISNGQSISQVSKFGLCYSICCLIWAIVGYAMGQIRTLNRFTWLANWAVFINLMVMFISMGVMAHSEPNYVGAQAGSSGAATGGSSVAQLPDGSYPPVITYGTVPPSDNGFIGSVVGLMQGVYAYAGAQLFIEFMAELQRPRDFLKVMWFSQFFIYVVYMVYGSYVYYWQGQYSNQISYMGLSPYSWQTACNIMGVISGLIAAVLYGNIGIKVIYNNILIEFFKFPPLTTRKGKYLWAAVVPIYWSIAFILSAAIPDFFGLTSLTAALFFVQFTYTFPALLGLGFLVQKEAMRGEAAFDPYTGEVYRRDSGVKRWIRGYFGRYWWACILLTVYALGGLVVSGLGAYASIESLIDAFKTPQINAFTCRSPLAG